MTRDIIRTLIFTTSLATRDVVRTTSLGERWEGEPAPPSPLWGLNYFCVVCLLYVYQTRAGRGDEMIGKRLTPPQPCRRPTVGVHDRQVFCNSIQFDSVYSPSTRQLWSRDLMRCYKDTIWRLGECPAIVASITSHFLEVSICIWAELLISITL